jgi:hypothetical protein
MEFPLQSLATDAGSPANYGLEPFACFKIYRRPIRVSEPEICSFQQEIVF